MVITSFKVIQGHQSHGIKMSWVRSVLNPKCLDSWHH